MAVFVFPGLAVGGFESLSALRGFFYMINVLFRVFLSRVEVNTSCRLVCSSD